MTIHYALFSFLNYIKHWTGELALQLRELAALAESPGLIPSVHMMAHNHVTPVPGNLMALSGLLRHFTYVVHRHVH